PLYQQGTPAVSAPAKSGIGRGADEAMDAIGESGIVIRISAPRGTTIAEKTLNPRMGITGGISVLGTTGLVEPWDDHLTESTMERVAAADRPVLTTGRTGLRFSRLLFPDREVILIGGKLNEALDAARGEVTLCGLPALILRHINPQILDGTGSLTVEDLVLSPQFPQILSDTLRKFRATRPGVTVVLVNREGRIIGESP
ncbi:MAG: cobalt-precorrin-5B (C(1))-methyltransferase, partial [Methanoregulaceae archaeon]